MACDATKIGIGASSANINTIETPKNETPLKIKYRKNNRCYRQLLDVFLSLSKPLLRRVFSQNLSLDQLSSAT